MPREYGKYFENKKYEFADDLRTACERYFRLRKQDRKPLTIAGLAVEIGVERHWFSQQQDPEIKKIAQWAQDKILADKEERLNLSTQGVIFDLVNNYPHLYKHRQEIVTEILPYLHRENAERTTAELEAEAEKLALEIISKKNKTDKETEKTDR